MMKNKISNNIKLERKKLGILQEHIAEEFNIRQSSISSIEKRIDSNTYVKYLFYLRKKGVDLNQLFDDSIQED